MIGLMTRDAAAWYFRRAEFAFSRWNGLTGEAKARTLADANAEFARLYPPPPELGLVTDSADAVLDGEARQARGNAHYAAVSRAAFLGGRDVRTQDGVPAAVASPARSAAEEYAAGRLAQQIATDRDSEAARGFIEGARAAAQATIALRSAEAFSGERRS